MTAPHDPDAGQGTPGRRPARSRPRRRLPAALVALLVLLGVVALDAAGGLRVDVARPVHDRAAGLLLETAGRTHVDGSDRAGPGPLAPSGAPGGRHLGPRPRRPGRPGGRRRGVLAALATQVRAPGARPWLLQSVAWTASGAVSVDPGTSVADLLALALSDVGDVRVLPVGDPVGGLARLPTAATAAAVAGAGLSCDG